MSFIETISSSSKPKTHRGIFPLPENGGQMPSKDEEHSIEQEVAQLRSQIDNATARLKELRGKETITTTTSSKSSLQPDPCHNNNDLPTSSTTTQAKASTGFNASSIPSHSLLLLADSALPLGSFAFSSGLESYLAHHPPVHNQRPETLRQFMHMSITSVASATLPYLLAAYTAPQRLTELDDTLDACILCPVARRASISQGRALISVWERSLKVESAESVAKGALQGFCMGLKMQPVGAVMGDGEEHEQPVELNAHFPLVYAVVCAAQGLSDHQTAYTYLFNHAKAVASAAVRAGVLGPYAAQALLGSNWLRAELERALASEWETNIEDAGQTVPAIDVWMGRHELLYSRIFNS